MVSEAAPVARLTARLARNRLDHELAAGADPSRSPALAARAAQLTSTGMRARIAAALERLALRPESDYGRFGVMPSRPAVRANRQALLDLAARLRDRGPVYAGGVAAARLTVVDGRGPAYTDRRGEALARALQLARRELHG